MNQKVKDFSGFIIVLGCQAEITKDLA